MIKRAGGGCKTWQVGTDLSLFIQRCSKLLLTLSDIAKFVKVCARCLVLKLQILLIDPSTSINRPLFMISSRRIDTPYFSPDTCLVEMWGFVPELKVTCSLWCCPPPWSIVVPAHQPWLILMRLTEPRPLSVLQLFRKGIIKLEDWRAPYRVRKVKGSVSGFFSRKGQRFYVTALS